MSVEGGGLGEHRKSQRQYLYFAVVKINEDRLSLTKEERIITKSDLIKNRKHDQSE